MQLKTRRLSPMVRHLLQIVFIVVPAILLWIAMGNVPQTTCVYPQGLLSQFYLSFIIVWLCVKIKEFTGNWKMKKLH